MNPRLAAVLIVIELAAVVWLAAASPIEGWLVNSICIQPTPTTVYAPPLPPEPTFRLDILNG